VTPDADVATPADISPLAHETPVDKLPVVLEFHTDVTAAPLLIVSHSEIAAAWILAVTDLNSAILAFCLADDKLTNTIEAKIPIIAITIKSSIKVKPCLIFINSPAFLFLFLSLS